MTRTVREVNLSTRTARDRLQPSGKPYFRHLDEGLHLGYRKGTRGAAWVVRWYIGAEKYKVASLDGRPDDELDADGATVLNWTQAQAEARRMFQQQQRLAAGLDAEPTKAGPYTVKSAIDDYLADLGRHGKTVKDATYRADALIIPQLGTIEVVKLTAAKIKAWHEEIATTGARLRQTAKDAEKGKTKLRSLDADDPEAVRRRRSSANRVLTILKAALNHAWREGKVPTDDAWRRVRAFREADAARVRYLTIDEAKRLMNACEPDFRALVHGALVTGARYGELAALEVHDYNPDAHTVHIRRSKTGKARHIVLNDEGVKLFERLTMGKVGNARIFLKADGTMWGKSHQFRPFKDACDRAKIVPPITFHELRHTWASLSIMAGAPLMVVAQNLGHADTRMVEKHYGHLAQSFVADTIRRTAPSFEDTKKAKAKPKRSTGQVVRMSARR